MNTGHYKMQTADCRLDLKYDKLQNAGGRLGLKYRWRPNLSHLLIRGTFSIMTLGSLYCVTVFGSRNVGLIISSAKITIIIPLGQFHSKENNVNLPLRICISALI